MEPIRVSPSVVIPGAAMRMRAVRASGPGGQNVNKVASKVELRVDLLRIHGLEPEACARLLEMAASRLDAAGLLLLVSQRTRDQSKNLDDARDKVRAIVARALVRPKRRRPTRPTSASREARLREKRGTAERKAARRRGVDD